MATANSHESSPSSGNGSSARGTSANGTAPTSFTASLWRRWLARRQRNQVRYLSQVKFRLTREGVHFVAVLLFIFIGAVIREINLLILLAGSMIGLLVLQWRFNTRTLLKLTARRRLPQYAVAGKLTSISLTLSNPKRWLGSWLVVVEDRLQKQNPNSRKLVERGMAAIEEIRPRGSAECRYELEFHERGKYQIGPTTISTRFPIGLGRGWRTLDNARTLIVRPRLGELTPNIRSLHQQLRIGHAAASPQAGTHEAEFYGLRPWQSGDSRRWIHWRTTARLGEVSVRQFERQQQRQITILLDLHSPKLKPGESCSLCELAISFVATIATQSAKVGSDSLSAAVAGDTVVTVTNVQSPVLVDNLLDSLATIAPAENPDLLKAIRSLTLSLVANPSLLIISTRASQLDSLRNSLNDPVGSKLLSRVKLKWLNVSAGQLEPYFSWTAN